MGHLIWPAPESQQETQREVVLTQGLRKPLERSTVAAGGPVPGKWDSTAQAVGRGQATQAAGR